MILYLIPIEERRTKTDLTHARQMVQKFGEHPEIHKVYYWAERQEIIARWVAQKCSKQCAMVLDQRLATFNVAQKIYQKPHMITRHIEAVLDKCEKKKDWSIPIFGGDSWLSYRKRLWKAVVENMINRDHPDAVLLLDGRTIATLGEMSAKAWKAEDLDPRAALLLPATTDKIRRIRTLDSPKEEKQETPERQEPSIASTSQAAAV